MSAAESLSTDRGIHIPPHHYTLTAQAGRGPGSPKLKTESVTQLVKPLTAETSDSTSDREADKPPPINSTHVKK